MSACVRRRQRLPRAAEDERLFGRMWEVHPRNYEGLRLVTHWKACSMPLAKFSAVGLQRLVVVHRHPRRQAVGALRPDRRAPTGVHALKEPHALITTNAGSRGGYGRNSIESRSNGI